MTTETIDGYEVAAREGAATVTLRVQADEDEDDCLVAAGDAVAHLGDVVDARWEDTDVREHVLVTVVCHGRHRS